MTVEFRFEGEAAAPRDAATVLVLRDGPSRVEVFFVKRDAAARFMGGAYVFPGGRLDPGDADPSVPCDLSPEAAAARWPGHDPLTARALHVAALREALEESGLLLCDPAPSADDITALRALLAPRESPPFGPLLSARGLTLRGTALRPWSRWVTPKQESRRFDARFFVAAAPPDLAALTHDGSETVDSAWLSPADAIERAARGEIVLAPPTWRTLAELSHARTVDEALALGPRDLSPVEPAVALLDDALTVLLPDDPAHPANTPHGSGVSSFPTRFTYHDGAWRPGE